VLRKHPKFGHDYYLQHPLQSIIHVHLVIQQYIYSLSDSIVE
jgi:hypothetical protein